MIIYVQNCYLETSGLSLEILLLPVYKGSLITTGDLCLNWITETRSVEMLLTTILLP